MKDRMGGLKYIGAASGVGFLGVILASAIFAWMMSKEILDQKNLALCGGAAMALGGILAGLGCGRGEGRWLRSAGAAGCLFLLLLAVNLIGFEGNLGGLVPGLGLATGATAAGNLLLGTPKAGKRRNYQIKKYRTG